MSQIDPLRAPPSAPRGRPVVPPRPLPPGFPPVLLLIGYVAIGSLPLLVADENAGGFWERLSNGLAMVCFALLSVQFILSGRLQAVTGRIGIDVVMHFHQRVAKLITFALVLHPFIYIVPMLLDDPLAAWARLVEMFSSPAMASGVLAWAILIGLTASSILRHWLPVPYEAWRLAHGLGALALVITGLHHVVNVGNHADDVTLAQLWILLVALAFGIVGYLYVIKPWQIAQRPYYVSHVHRVGEGLWGITLWPAKLQPIGVFARGMKPKITAAMPFEAGQFAWITIGASPYAFTDHPLSIASAPADSPRFRFIIKEVGDFSKTVGRIPVGTRAYMDGPCGTFTLSAAAAALPKNAPVKGIAFIAGGVGIAPILSLLRHCKASGDTRPLRLIYGNRSAAQIVSREELDALEGEADFRARYVLQEPPYDWPGGTGMIDPTAIDQWIDWPDAAEWLYFVCGPTAMLTIVEHHLIARGVPAARIVSEKFRFD